jgi:hypothetical protein
MPFDTADLSVALNNDDRSVIKGYFKNMLDQHLNVNLEAVVSAHTAKYRQLPLDLR